MKLHGKHIIGGEPQRVGQAIHHGRNAATGEALEPALADASAAEIDAALDLAELAHEEGLGNGRQRATFLRAAADAIDALGDELSERGMAETGLPHARLEGERGRTINQLRMFADLVEAGDWVDFRCDPALPDRKPAPRPDLRRMLVPIGPVVVFGAGNFPLAFSVAGGDTASALAAGCPVVVKAHPSHPGTSELVAGALSSAVSATGLPAGAFSMVHGPSHGVGGALVEHPKTRAVAFTGSLAGGRALCRLAAARPRPIPVYAEMGSINPVFVLPEALAVRGGALAQASARSLTLGVGQFCTNPGVFSIPSGTLGDRFIADMLSALAQVEPGVMLDARVLEGYRSGVERRGALAGVDKLMGSSANPERATPAVFATDAAHFLAEPSLHDELFGPACLIVRWDDDEQLLALARSFEGQLSASIHAEPSELERTRPLARILVDRVGRLLFDGFPTGVEVCSAMQHGGPWPASSDSRTTSVGTAAIERFARPVCWQNAPHELLPPELRD